MRVLHALAAIGVATALPACVFVERDRTPPARPAAVPITPGGGAVITPGVAPVAPPAAVIVR